MGMGEWVGEDVLLIGSDKWVWRLPDSNKSEENNNNKNNQSQLTTTRPYLINCWVDVSLFNYH